VPDRRGSRFLVEVLFLLGLATALTLAKLAALEIAGVMLLGWVIVAALEWAAWRGEPHYGSGLPPRYYVPRLNLPPAQPLEQVATGYPEAARDEAPTWIASAALREELLGEWPLVMPVAEPQLEVKPELESPPGVAARDPWLIVELPVAPLGEEDGEPEPEPEPDPEPEPEREPKPEPAAAPQADEPRPVIADSAHGVSRYSFDPLAEPAPRRRFGRGGGEAPDTVEVPARPAGPQSLPGRMST
jgi:hypothetical protein